KLQNAIRTSMGVSLSLKDMYHASTLGGMVALTTQRKSADCVPEVIDWEGETALPRSLDLNIHEDAIPVKKGGRLEVLMTGST
ncbi:hypothetical protein, partial [Salmonella enterica]|uniref:hypothetical protein n=1 Tax=Salmonella enterica TaxID=28901 RepID=UPI0020C2A10A